jgi:hypothetical protein
MGEIVIAVTTPSPPVGRIVSILRYRNKFHKKTRSDSLSGGFGIITMIYPMKICYRMKGAGLHNSCNQLCGTGRVTCFIIIPADHFHKVAIHFDGSAIKDTGVRITNNIG